ncbi:MAG: biotin/lipoyl-binding protein, partial [Treponema sp.]|nr:biotin/lipoyl-binding protein [Treponema sp.]
IPSEYGKFEDECKKLLGTQVVSPEDVLTLAMFPKIAPDFFKNRDNGPVVFKPEAAVSASAQAPSAPIAAAATLAAAPPKIGEKSQYNVSINGVNYDVVISSAAIGNTADASAAPVQAPSAPAAAAPAAAVPAPVAGSIFRYAVDEGAEVKAGDTIIIMESMKMELEIKVSASGKVRFLVPIGASVAANQPIAEILGAPSSAPGQVPAASPANTQSTAPPPSKETSGVAQLAPVAGSIFRLAADEGARVKTGDTILIMESMKMELEIKSTASGVLHFLVPAGASVAAGQPIAEIG